MARKKAEKRDVEKATTLQPNKKAMKGYEC